MNHSIDHLFSSSFYHMANIASKNETFRRAIAMGRIHVGKEVCSRIKNQSMPKGDPLKLAEMAGVQAAKMAWQQIPLCHPLLLEHVAIACELEEKTNSVVVYSVASIHSKTGVEMEALAAVNGALLTIYDLSKPVEPALTISNIKLLMKEGGKKGLWLHPEGVPDTLLALLNQQQIKHFDGISFAVITLSDRASRNEYSDTSGEQLTSTITTLGGNVVDYQVIADEPSQLKALIKQLSDKVNCIITTGGTGLSPRDITPQVLHELADYEVPGIGEHLRSSSANKVPTTWLSRSLAVVIGKTIVIAFPGSTGAVKDGLEVLQTLIPHALDHLANKTNLHAHPKDSDQ